MGRGSRLSFWGGEVPFLGGESEPGQYSCHHSDVPDSCLYVCFVAAGLSQADVWEALASATMICCFPSNVRVAVIIVRLTCGISHPTKSSCLKLLIISYECFCASKMR